MNPKGSWRAAVIVDFRIAAVETKSASGRCCAAAYKYDRRLHKYVGQPIVLYCIRKRFSSKNSWQMARDESENTDRSVVKSVGRVFEVLEAFNEVRQPMPAMQIAKRLSYPPSSTIALLKSMAKLGYLSFDRTTRTYFPTMRVAIISEYLHGALVGDGRLLALMGDLHRQIGETIILAIQNDLDAQYIHVIPGRYPIMLNVQPGDLRPLCRSGAGWALLSQRSNKEIAQFVNKINLRGDEPVIDIAELLPIIEEVRVLSYARSYGTYFQGSGSIAMSVSVGTNQPIAICIGGPVDRLQSREREIVRAVRGALSRHFPA